MSIDEILKDYYPFTDQCPNGGTCKKEKCKHWKGEKICWYYEFNKLACEVFDLDLGYIHFDFKDQRMSGLSISVNLRNDDETNFSALPQMDVSISFNSKRLAEIVKTKFALTDWKVESRCYEGGDDHDLVLVCTAIFEEKENIKKTLNNVKIFVPQIIEFEDEANTCQMCKEHCESLTDYKQGCFLKSICYNCEQKIINENLLRYFI